MIHKARSKEILSISLPIIGGMVSQNILNLVDSAMVGSISATALGAVGLGGFINFMCVAFFLGFGAGVQAMVSRRIGEERIGEAAHPLNGALLILLITAIPATVLFYYLAPWLMSITNSNPEVAREGVPYLQARFLGILALGIHFSFRGFWSAVDMTKVYLHALLIAHSSNVIISYVLIFGKLGLPALGTFGAGLGTTISLCIAVIYYFIVAGKKARQFGFLEHLPSKTALKQVIKTSIPASLQQFLFAAGFTMMLWIVGKLGIYELAASNIILNLMLVGILPALGFGIGGATLVGRSLGRKDVEGAHLWGWDATKLAVIVVFVLMLPVFLFPDGILKIFLHEQAAIDVARLPLRIAAGFLALETIGVVLFNAINGAGDTKSTMIVSFTFQWLLFLPVAWLVGPHWGLGLTAIWIAHVSYRVLLTVTMIILWEKRNWSRIQLD
ncbi:MATE family efflux transporter [Marinicella sp. W31]|uniref:MATE family efflux transporter n=1 Tax=Marinicella sp. W31 TaxID=3023713 RepID=UPI0037574600